MGAGHEAHNTIVITTTNSEPINYMFYLIVSYHMYQAYSFYMYILTITYTSYCHCMILVPRTRFFHKKLNGLHSFHQRHNPVSGVWARLCGKCNNSNNNSTKATYTQPDYRYARCTDYIH